MQVGGPMKDLKDFLVFAFFFVLLVLILTPILNLLPSGFMNSGSAEEGWQAESEILMMK